MKISVATKLARLPVSLHWHLALIVGMLLSSTQLLAATPAPLFSVPQPKTAAVDEILLISTRALGTVCTGQRMTRDLRCRRYVVGPKGTPRWQSSDWRRLLTREKPMQTVVYVHGNRVSAGEDIEQGLLAYSSLKKNRRHHGPIRFIIWSWPSTQISRPVKDYRVKARRTVPAAWQLAWLLDKLPAENPLSLVGYSYGTRVVSGATHLLAGGSLGKLRLRNRQFGERPPIRMGLIAAAYDADWIQPRNVFGRAVSQVDRLVLVTNELDPAMRFYHLSNGRGRMHALGKSGVDQPRELGKMLGRLRILDATPEVGRSHAITDYLAAHQKMAAMWRQLVDGQEAQLGGSGDPLDRGYWVSQ